MAFDSFGNFLRKVYNNVPVTCPKTRDRDSIAIKISMTKKINIPRLRRVWSKVMQHSLMHFHSNL